MKRLLLLALLAISMLPVYSQTSVGVIAGYHLSSVHYSADVPFRDDSFKQSWRAGLIADHRLWKKLYLQPQLLLNEKGGRSEIYQDMDTLTYSNKGNTRLLYLELQANFVFKEQVGKGKFFAGAGPYLGRGISGSSKIKGYMQLNDQKQHFEGATPIKFSNKNKNSSADYYQKPYDAGVNFQAGYELQNGLFFNAVYSLGLVKSSYEDTYKPKNTYFGLSVGYFFKKFS